MILINHTSAPVRKERLRLTSKARREVSRNKFMEKSRMPDRVKRFGEINSREDRPRARLGFVKSKLSRLLLCLQIVLFKMVNVFPLLIINQINCFD